jgi:hypothetical protein
LLLTGNYQTQQGWGTRDASEAHVVSAWASEASLVLGQMRVGEKTNEIKAIPELLDILQVKGNQETLLEDISLYFEKDIFLRKKKEPENEGRYSRGMDSGHGRQEIREYND